jgi:hypothetical protein
MVYRTQARHHAGNRLGRRGRGRWCRREGGVRIEGGADDGALVRGTRVVACTVPLDAVRGRAWLVALLGLRWIGAAARSLIARLQAATGKVGRLETAAVGGAVGQARPT